MSTRYEILKNGKRVCISGLNGNGVLSVGLSYVKPPQEGLPHYLHIGGLGIFDSSEEQAQHASWRSPDIAPGDEITIRILPAGDYDQPQNVGIRSSKTIDDAEFGKMDFCLNTWHAEIPFALGPLETARIHLRADEAGPSQHQRELINEFRIRHAQLWPEISTALTKCHPENITKEKLVARLEKHLGIAVTDEPQTVRITYRIGGESKPGDYFITLRNWEIVEVTRAAN